MLKLSQEISREPPMETSRWQDFLIEDPMEAAYFLIGYKTTQGSIPPAIQGSPSGDLALADVREVLWEEDILRRANSRIKDTAVRIQKARQWKEERGLASTRSVEDVIAEWASVQIEHGRNRYEQANTEENNG